MQHGDDELHLLCHAFGELLHFFVPPVGYLKMLEPLFETGGGFGFSEAFEACEEESLIAHLHFLVQTTFLGEIAYGGGVGGCEAMAVEGYCTGVGCRYMVDGTNERCFSCAVGSEQSVDASPRHGEAYVVKGFVLGEGLAYAFNRDDVVHFGR